MGQALNIFTGKVNHMILIDQMMSFTLWMSAFVSLRHQTVNFQQTEAKVPKIFSSVRQNWNLKVSDGPKANTYWYIMVSKHLS